MTFVKAIVRAIVPLDSESSESDLRGWLTGWELGSLGSGKLGRLEDL